MKKYVIEFVGTFLFVLSIIGIVQDASALIPLYIGIALTTLVYMGGGISGAHYNPAVTLSIFINKKISSRDALGYIISQLLWALCAYIVMTQWLDISLPAVALTSSMKSIFIAELLFTFALVSTVLYTAVNPATAGNSYFGIAIGAIVAIGIVVVGQISGWFFNPAVLFGIGMFWISLKTALIILLGQLAGATWAAFLYRYIVRK
jgi:aquaporin Z